MQTSFTPQEQELIQKLKEKYGGVRNEAEASAGQADIACLRCEAGAPSGQEPAACGRPRPSSNVEATVCPHCHGTGTLVEIYNHRRLENYCKECEGRGVRVFKGGVQVKDGVKSTSTAAPSTSSSAQGPAGVVALHRGNGSGQNPAGGDAGSDPAVLQKDLQRIAAKLAAYNKERLDALAVLQRPAGSGTDPAGRDSAARDLVAQLELQLERLELARAKKQAALDRMRKAGTATLDDIIANEGPRV